jgi:hypothetical protein
MSGRHAHHLIDTVNVFTNIQKLNLGSVSDLPKSEKVVRPLVSLTPEQQTNVWNEACKEANGQPTSQTSIR